MLKFFAKPRHHIHTLDAEWACYLETLDQNTSDSQALLNQIIIEPLLEQFVYRAEFPHTALSMLKLSSPETRDLKLKLDLFKEHDVKKLINDTLLKCQQHLKSKTTCVYVLPSFSETSWISSTLGGIAACTIGKGKILLFIDPTFTNWDQMLPYAIAHEYHHSVVFGKINQNRLTLFDFIMMEGKADAFANILFPKVALLWLKGHLDPQIWEKLYPDRYRYDSDFVNKILYSGDDFYPPFTGYKVGYEIMQHFLIRHPNVPISKWSFYHPEYILQKSGFGMEDCASV